MITNEEREYLESMRTEFGGVFGTNEAYSRPPQPPAPLPPLPKIVRRPTRPLASLAESERAEILRLRLQHVSWREIEQRFNVSAAAIHQIQLAAGYSWPNTISELQRLGQL